MSETQTPEQIASNPNENDKAVIDYIENPDNYKYITRLCRGLLGGRVQSEVIEDIVQQTFLNALRKKDSLRHKSNIKAWVSQIANNLCTDLIRRRMRHPEISTDDNGHENGNNVIDNKIESNGKNGSGLAGQIERKILLERLKTKIPKEQWESLHLHYIEGMDEDEIAKTFNVAPGTVKSRIHRGTTAARAYLNKHVNRKRNGKIKPIFSGN